MIFVMRTFFLKQREFDKFYNRNLSCKKLCEKKSAIHKETLDVNPNISAALAGAQ